MILRKIKNDVEVFLKKEIKEVVITTPFCSNQMQRKATIQVAEIVGLKVRKIINEPTAAAIALAYQSSDNLGNKNWIFDFWGGKLDLSLLNLIRGRFCHCDVLYFYGDTHLGGQYIDNKIYEVPIHLLRKVKLISGMLEQASDEGRIILLSEVKGNILELILEYLRHYKNFEPKKFSTPFPRKANKNFLKEILNDEWTFNFLQKLSIYELVTLNDAAEYLQIKGLDRILTAKISYDMNRLDMDEVKEKLGLDFDCLFKSNFEELEELERNVEAENSLSWKYLFIIFIWLKIYL